jgi:hypothetical protein
MTKRISMVVTYDTGSREFFVDSDTTEAHFPEGLCWDDETEYWADEPLLAEDVVQRLAVQLSSPAPPTALRAREPVAISTKFIELALNILDPKCKWDAEETLEVCDAAGEFLREYPIIEWEIEGAFGLVVQFAHDWATGEYSNSAPSNGPASVFTPSSHHDLSVLELVIDEGPTFE